MKIGDIFKVDGKAYNVFIPEDGIKRSFAVLDRDNTTRLTNGDMVRHVIGTFYNYTIEIDAKHTSKEEYDRLYEVLSAPTAFHTLQVPYGQELLTFQAYVTSGKDTLKKSAPDGNTWHGLSVYFVAKSPKRRAL